MDPIFSIDLNQPPPIFDCDSHNEEREIPISVTASSSGNYLIELANYDQMIGSHVIELNLQDFREDDDEASSDSSEEEFAAQQTSNYATTTLNGETRSSDRPNTSQGIVSCFDL